VSLTPDLLTVQIFTHDNSRGKTSTKFLRWYEHWHYPCTTRNFRVLKSGAL